MTEDDDRDEPIEEIEDPVACAAGGSPEISRTPRALFFAGATVVIIGLGAAAKLTEAAFFAVLALAVYFLITGRWRCSECGSTWD